jgi:aminoglycoside 3-N-acetyltransferase
VSREAEVIQNTVGGPVTTDRIRAALGRLGVREADALLVHASLSSLGFVPGGAQAVVEALTAAVGPAGLVAAPAFTTHLSEPATWRRPPVPRKWFEAIRSGMTPFDPQRSPSRQMGAVSEQIRTTPGALRSAHPHVSFAVLGVRAREIVEPHPLEAWLGDGSPLQRLYEFDAKVLFLGTGYRTCSTFHLAEHRAGVLRFVRSGAPVLVNDVRHWVAFDAPDWDTSRFEALGAAFEATSSVAFGNVGMADCRLFSIRSAVDFVEASLRSRAPSG